MDTTTLSQVLRSEVEKIKTDVLEALDICSVTEFDDPDKLHAIEVLAEHLEHIGDAADVIEFTGVKEICTFMNDSLLEFVAGDQNTRHEWKIFYGRNIDLLLDYLNAPAEPHICDQLVTHIATAPTPLSDDNLLLLKELLLNIPQLSVTTSLGEDISLLEDISLDIPEHVDPVLFESFLQEALHNVAELNAITQRLGDGKYTYEEIELARRISHTLKGSASIVGIRGIATLSHYIEDIFQLLDNDALQPPSDFFTTLLDASECLAHMVDYLMGQEEAPTNVHTVLTEISSWTRHLSTDNSEAQHIDVIDSTIGVTVLPESVMEPNALPALFNSQPSTNNSPNASQPRREPTLRVSIQTLNELFRLLNEMSMKIGYLGERLEQTIQRSKGLLTQNSRVSKRVSELENVVGLRGFSVAPIHGISSTTDYDPLEMDRYSEVYCTTRSLIEEVTDAREIGVSLDEDINSLSSLLAQQERANKDLQYYLLSARMTSIESIVPRLVRNVKQTCRSIGKRAELTITGADIQIDTELLNKLSDPLLHILRNAVDHGIESAEERRLQNKPDVGNISLTFERYGQSILVRCQDDGRGLDYSAIRMKAIQKGLITPDQNLSQSELARLILLPGFPRANTLPRYLAEVSVWM